MILVWFARIGRYSLMGLAGFAWYFLGGFFLINILSLIGLALLVWLGRLCVLGLVWMVWAWYFCLVDVVWYIC